jgi:hypothetical protein
MSAMAAEKIRHPEELTIDREKILSVLPHLSPEGREVFLNEIVEAVADAKDDGNLAHINHVIEAWYRTLLFKMNDEHDERWNHAQKVIASDPEGLDRAGVRRALSLPEE